MKAGEARSRQTQCIGTTSWNDTVHWYDVLEQTYSDLLGGGGGPPFLRSVPPSYIGTTYTRLVKSAARTWVRTPTASFPARTHGSEFPATTDVWLVNESYSRFELSIEMHCAVEIDTH